MFEDFLKKKVIINRGPINNPVSVTNPIKGNRFLFTGRLNGLVRADAESLVIKYGGSVSSTATANVNYLVTGETDHTTKKLADATRKGITIINEDKFKDMVEMAKDAK